MQLVRQGQWRQHNIDALLQTTGSQQYAAGDINGAKLIAVPSSEGGPQEALHFRLSTTPASLTGVYAADNRWASLQHAVGPPLHRGSQLVLQAGAGMVGWFSYPAVHLQCTENVLHELLNAQRHNTCTVLCP